MPIVVSNPFVSAESNLELGNTLKVIMDSWGVVKAEVEETAKAVGAEVVPGEPDTTFLNLLKRLEKAPHVDVVATFGHLQAQYEGVLKTEFAFTPEHASLYLGQSKNVVGVMTRIRDEVISGA